jgi:hypothetical protein
MRRLAPLLVVLAASAVAPTPAVAAKKIPRAPQGWLGAMADGPMIRAEGAPSGEWRRMRRNGVQTVRAALYWSDAQPHGPGEYDWREADRMVGSAAAQGMRLLPVVTRAPSWARDGDTATPPRDPADYARFMQALVARYGPRGIFWDERPDVRRMPVRRWQIWNEPHLRSYWNRSPWARTYVELLRAAAAAIRATDPGARVVLAGLANRSWEELRRIYEAGGRGHFDIVALHAYTSHPKNVVRALRYGRKVMAEFGDRRLRIWATEISFPAVKRSQVRYRPGFATTRKGQARRLYETLQRLARARKELKLEGAIWYTWLSRYSSRDWEDYSGLRRMGPNRTTSMPSLKRFRRAARQLQR